MRPIRRAMVMTLVATALCADRTVISSAAVVPQAVRPAQTLVGRLTAGLRRATPVVRLFRFCQDTHQAVAAIRPGREAPAVRCFHSPFQFRLPPPVAGL